MTSTPRRASCCAISSFSCVFSEMPGDCSPSRSVVSKIFTRSCLAAVHVALSSLPGPAVPLGLRLQAAATRYSPRGGRRRRSRRPDRNDITESVHGRANTRHTAARSDPLASPWSADELLRRVATRVGVARHLAPWRLRASARPCRRSALVHVAVCLRARRRAGTRAPPPGAAARRRSRRAAARCSSSSDPLASQSVSMFSPITDFDSRHQLERVEARHLSEHAQLRGAGCGARRPAPRRRRSTPAGRRRAAARSSA